MVHLLMDVRAPLEAPVRFDVRDAAQVVAAGHKPLRGPHE